MSRGIAALAAYAAPAGIVHTSAAPLLGVHQEGSAIIMWTASGHDWQRCTTASSADRDVLRDASGGSIVLLHDAIYYRKQTWRVTFEAIPLIVAELRQRGLTVGPIGGRAALLW